MAPSTQTQQAEQRRLIVLIGAATLLLAALAWLLAQTHLWMRNWPLAAVISLIACSGWIAAGWTAVWHLLKRWSQTRQSDMEATISQLVETFCMSVEMKDPYTRGHSERMTAYLLYLAEKVYGKLTPADEARIRYGGLLHDIGKIYVPDELLRKPEHLLAEEFEVVRAHPQTGADIVSHIPGLSSSIPIILHHHERFDGRGYPKGLSGHTIPLEARMAAIADTFDAITSTRAYRGAQSVEAALQEIITQSGDQFDPDLVQTFVHHFHGIRQLHHQFQQQTLRPSAGL